MATPTPQTLASIGAQAPLVTASTSPEWEGKLDLVKRTVAVGATNDELDLFLYQARRSGLDPLSRQIHYIKRGGKGTIQVGIDGYRLIATRSNVYAGNDDAVFAGTTEAGFPATATVTVHRLVSGIRCAFTATARWDEYYPGDQQGFQWRKMPHTMLSKCAEALALRKAFPAELSGIYVYEEMSQGGSPDAPINAEYSEDESDPKAQAAPTAQVPRDSGTTNSSTPGAMTKASSTADPLNAEDVKIVSDILERSGIAWATYDKDVFLSWLAKGVRPARTFKSFDEVSGTILANKRKALELWDRGEKSLSDLDPIAEAHERTWLLEEAGMTEADVADFIAWCDGRQTFWSAQSREARGVGVTTKDQLYHYLENGVMPTNEDDQPSLTGAAEREKRKLLVARVTGKGRAVAKGEM